MPVPEIHYISDMLALPSQFTSDDKCQGENPQQRVQKAAVLKLWVMIMMMMMITLIIILIIIIVDVEIIIVWGWMLSL